MVRAGIWRTTGRPHHVVPAQEEGEPPAQRPRYENTLAGLDVARNLPEVDSPPSHSSSDSPPALEASPTAEGNECVWEWILGSCMGEPRFNLASRCV